MFPNEDNPLNKLHAKRTRVNSGAGTAPYSAIPGRIPALRHVGSSFQPGALDDALPLIASSSSSSPSSSSPPPNYTLGSHPIGPCPEEVVAATPRTLLSSPLLLRTLLSSSPPPNYSLAAIPFAPDAEELAATTPHTLLPVVHGLLREAVSFKRKHGTDAGASGAGNVQGRSDAAESGGNGEGPVRKRMRAAEGRWRSLQGERMEDVKEEEKEGKEEE